MSIADTSVPMRADARRNRALILGSAREAFSDNGLDVGMEEIANRAGVGKATCFRHFPTKDALILAVLEGFIADQEEMAERAAVAEDPWEGLRGFVLEHARTQSENEGFFDAIAARFHAEQLVPQEFVERMTAAAEKVLAPARDAGLLRDGVEAGDLTAILKMLGTAVRPIPDVSLEESMWSRYADLLLGGIRAGQAPLPGTALDYCALSRSAGRMCD